MQFRWDYEIDKIVPKDYREQKLRLEYVHGLGNYIADMFPPQQKNTLSNDTQERYQSTLVIFKRKEWESFVIKMKSHILLDQGIFEKYLRELENHPPINNPENSIK